MNNKWLKVEDKTMPRYGELIVVRSEKSIYPYVLVVKGVLDWWRYYPERINHYKVNDFYGVKLAFHGITHWTCVGHIDEESWE